MGVEWALFPAIHNASRRGSGGSRPTLASRSNLPNTRRRADGSMTMSPLASTIHRTLARQLTAALALVALVLAPGCLGPGTVAESESDDQGVIAVSALRDGRRMETNEDAAHSDAALSAALPSQVPADDFAFRAEGTIPQPGWVVYRIPLDRRVDSLDYEITVTIKVLDGVSRGESTFVFLQPPVLVVPGARPMDEPHVVLGNAATLERPFALERSTTAANAKEALMYLASGIPVEYTIQTAVGADRVLQPTGTGTGARILASSGPDPLFSSASGNDMIDDAGNAADQGTKLRVKAVAPGPGIQIIGLTGSLAEAATRHVKFSNEHESFAAPPLDEEVATPFAPAGEFWGEFRGVFGEDARAYAMHIAMDVGGDETNQW